MIQPTQILIQTKTLHKIYAIKNKISKKIEKGET